MRDPRINPDANGLNNPSGQDEDFTEASFDWDTPEPLYVVEPEEGDLDTGHD